ncbi:hypothetical protein KSS87_016414 [Heliosperma pusillum]|nr:hypothetical protein KSS87_016414 [Heliosperma pusillum]
MGCASSLPDRNGVAPNNLNPSTDPASDAKNLKVKLVVLGNSGVGKSCIVLRFVRGQFDPTSKVTVGASFLSQTIALQDSSTVKFEIWDTAGQERYAALAPLYYRGAAVAVIVYDITNLETFTKAQYWVKVSHRPCFTGVDDIDMANPSMASGYVSDLYTLYIMLFTTNSAADESVEEKHYLKKDWLIRSRV